MEKVGKEDAIHNFKIAFDIRRYPLHVYCIFLGILTASFDIFMTIDIGGFTFRISQVFFIIAIIWMIAVIVKQRKIFIPIEGFFLLTWIILQGFFISNSPNIKNAISYFLWLLIDVLIVMVIYYSFNTKKSFEKLFKFYIDSFMIMSILGIMQLLLSIIGVRFYVVQMWTSRWARINGFTYEPSYYSTYLLPGWIIVMYLLENETSLYTNKQLRVRAILITLALFLSTSRMGWLMMVFWILLRVGIYMKNFFTGKIKSKHIKMIGLLFLATILGVMLFQWLNAKMDISFLLDGLAILNSDGHSSTARIDVMIRAFSVFKEHPWYGVSLGGVDPAVAEMYNMAFENGMSACVWVEILVASGIFGTIIFGGWIVCFIKKVIVISKMGKYEAKALIYAFLFECMILSFNQNILRIYFWILIGVISSLCRAYKR